MSQFTAIFDACVLYPAPLRDLLMRFCGIANPFALDHVTQASINSDLRTRYSHPKMQHS